MLFRHFWDWPVREIGKSWDHSPHNQVDFMYGHLEIQLVALFELQKSRGGKVPFRHHFQYPSFCKGFSPFIAHTQWHADLSLTNKIIQHSLLLHPVTRWVLHMIIIDPVSLSNI